MAISMEKNATEDLSKENSEEQEAKAEEEGGEESPERFRLSHTWSLLKETAKVWNDHHPWRLGAVVAYYAILALPGLLVLIARGVGELWGEDIVEGKIVGEIAEIIGHETAEAVQAMLEGTVLDEQNIFMAIAGIGILIFAATGVFYHLQLSLNDLWDIRQDPESNILKFLLDRAIGLGFVLVVGFLLLVSFVFSAVLTALSNFLSSIWEPGWIVMAQIMDFVLSSLFVGVLFALIFRYLPDARATWRTTFVGAIFTAVLFNIGVFFLGIYFGQAEPGSVYGAAGSVVALLLWFSYACLILFFGAALVRVWAYRYGAGLEPRGQAVLIERKEIPIERKFKRMKQKLTRKQS